MENSTIKYDFDHPILKKDKKYRRYAREHMAIAELKSDVIKWEVIKSQTALNIPVQYHVHYNIKSIVGIDDQKAPIFGHQHTLDISIPPRYPLVPCIIKMISPVWHPNIKFDGNYKGRICGNVKNFGKAYDLYQLVLRIGEILQYKNYHAEHIPPYPEDSKVAVWVMSYAEPKNIVNKNEYIYIDNTPLLRSFKHSDSTATETRPVKESPAPPASETLEVIKPKIKIKQQKKQVFKRSKLVIKIKKDNKDK